MKPSTKHPRFQCEIHIQAVFSRELKEWFEELSPVQADHGVTILKGPILDQAAIHGLMSKIRDLGLPIEKLSIEKDPV